MIPGFYEYWCRILNNSKRRVPSKQGGLQLQYKKRILNIRRLRVATFSKYSGALVCLGQGCRTQITKRKGKIYPRTDHEGPEGE